MTSDDEKRLQSIQEDAVERWIDPRVVFLLRLLDEAQEREAKVQELIHAVRQLGHSYGGVSATWDRTRAAVSALAASPAEKPKPSGRTFENGGVVYCDECCNGDRCDDPTHRQREGCPYCLGTGVIKPPTESGRGGDEMSDPSKHGVNCLAAMNYINAVTGKQYECSCGVQPSSAASKPMSVREWLRVYSCSDWYVAMEAYAAYREAPLLEQLAAKDAKIERLRDAVPHPGDGSCDHCGRVPAVDIPTSLCNECRDGVKRAEAAEAELATKDVEIEELKAARKHTQEWFTRHYGKLQDWARKRLPDNWKHEFFNCIAYGIWSMTEDNGEPYTSVSGHYIVPHNYFTMGAQEQILHDQMDRAENAEAQLASERQIADNCRADASRNGEAAQKFANELATLKSRLDDSRTNADHLRKRKEYYKARALRAEAQVTSDIDLINRKSHKITKLGCIIKALRAAIAVLKRS